MSLQKQKKWHAQNIYEIRRPRKILIYVTITKTGKTADGDRKSPNSAIDFIDGEKITANAEITHTTEYKQFEFSAEVFQPTGFGSATSVGTAVSVSAGVFYAKGTFVETKSSLNSKIGAIPTFATSPVT